MKESVDLNLFNQISANIGFLNYLLKRDFNHNCLEKIAEDSNQLSRQLQALYIKIENAEIYEEQLEILFEDPAFENYFNETLEIKKMQRECLNSAVHIKKRYSKAVEKFKPIEDYPENKTIKSDYSRFISEFKKGFEENPVPDEVLEY
jgi:hypothetical protein